jgi:LmbE family N-acetylglucosaminyl deacetylase
MISIAACLARFEALPPATLNDLLGGRRPLILAPHPDDESLGCGGLIAACCAAGIQPVVAILTDGAASHPGSLAYPPERLAALREQEARNAVKILGLAPENLHFLHYADTDLPKAGARFETAVAFLMHIAGEGDCGVVFAPWIHDPHCDHEAAALIALALARRETLPLFSYPVWGWLRASGDEITAPEISGFRLDVSPHLVLKQSAIAAHESQYGALITDSPDGFRLPRELLEVFARPFEVFVTT